MTDGTYIPHSTPPDLKNFKVFMRRQPSIIIAELLAAISRELFFRGDWPGVAFEVRRASDDLANLARHQGDRSSVPTECLDPWEAGLNKVREALGSASNELHDLEWEPSYCAVYKRLDQFVDAASGTLTELIDARHGDPSGDYDAS